MQCFVDQTIKVDFLACLAASLIYSLFEASAQPQNQVSRRLLLLFADRFSSVPKFLPGKEALRSLKCFNSDFIWTLDTKQDRNKNLAKSVRL